MRESRSSLSLDLLTTAPESRKFENIRKFSFIKRKLQGERGKTVCGLSLLAFGSPCKIELGDVAFALNLLLQEYFPRGSGYHR